jgi:hypothetical protein
LGFHEECDLVVKAQGKNKFVRNTFGEETGIN